MARNALKRALATSTLAAVAFVGTPALAQAQEAPVGSALPVIPAATPNITDPIGELRSLLTPAEGDAAALRSGSQIIIDLGGKAQGLCTLNSIVEKNGTVYGITAGHCLEPSQEYGPVTRILARDGSVISNEADMKDSGYVMEGEASPFSPNEALNDFAWFKINQSVVTDANTIAGGYTANLPIFQPVADILTVPRAELGAPVPVTKDLEGRVVCKDGSMTGRTCGMVLQVNENSQEIYAVIPAIQGDSGSPLHVLGDDGKRHVVGTLSNGTPVLFNVFDGTQEHLNTVG